MVCMSVKLARRSQELRQATAKLEKFEKIYTAMTLEIQNMTDAMLLQDHEGIKIFYDKLYALHQQFMSIR
jgi:hypothetical protein